MDRIIGANTIDLGGGRRGFRGKDTVAGIPGTELAAKWHNDIQEEIVGLGELCGFDPEDNVTVMLALAIQSGKLNFAVATGSANAWQADPVLDVPAYSDGRPLWIVPPATNTSTTVNCDVSDLGDRRIKKSDGSDPAIGDLVGGRAYETIQLGGSIRVLSTLPSDIAATIKAQKAVFNVQSITNGTRATLTGPGDGATWRTMFSGSYAKQSATSNILWSLSIPLWAPGNTATRQRFLMGGGSAVEGVTQYSFGSNVNGHMTLSGVVSGLGAGAQAWSADLSRSNDAVSWSMVVNPSSTDSQFYTAAGTSSSVIIQEFEP